MVNIYSDKEIKILSESGAILSSVLRATASLVRPGMTTLKLDRIAREKIKAAGAKPAFLGYTTGGLKPFPAALCTSVNDGLVHGFPSDTPLREGDILSLDLGVNSQGYFTDMAITVPVGKISRDASALIRTTEKALDESLKILKPGMPLGDLGASIQSFARKKGLGVVRDLVGHGVGKAVHEDPQVPNYGEKNTGLKLVAGMVLAIEPMFTLGSGEIRFAPDGWQIFSADGSHCAHFEKTVAITEIGYQILTP